MVYRYRDIIPCIRQEDSQTECRLLQTEEERAFGVEIDGFKIPNGGSVGRSVSGFDGLFGQDLAVWHEG